MFGLNSVHAASRFVFRLESLVTDASEFAVKIPLYENVSAVFENVKSLVDNLNTSYAGPEVFPDKGVASDEK